MNTLELVQGSAEWIAARVGSLGASRIHEAIAKTKNGYGASRANLMSELIVERLTGKPAERFVSAAMEHGTLFEPDARGAYEFLTGATVDQVGLVLHPSIKGTHASPDGLIGEEGILEIKCPSSATHLETLLGLALPSKYVAQMTWQMVCCKREFGDFVSYHPKLPPDMRFFCKRVELDHEFALELEAEVKKFLAELDAKIAALTTFFRKEAA